MEQMEKVDGVDAEDFLAELKDATAKPNPLQLQAVGDSFWGNSVFAPCS